MNQRLMQSVEGRTTVEVRTEVGPRDVRAIVHPVRPRRGGGRQRRPVLPGVAGLLPARGRVGVGEEREVRLEVDRRVLARVGGRIELPIVRARRVGPSSAKHLHRNVKNVSLERLQNWKARPGL